METNQHLSLLSDLLTKAKGKGADSADALFIEGTSLSVICRMGKIENLQRSEGGEIGLRVMIGHRQAIVSSSDWSSESLDTLAERAILMARIVPEDPFCGLADSQDLAKKFLDLDLFDPSEPEPNELIDLAKIAEDTARSVTGITNSEGAEAGWGQNSISMVTTNGFSRSWKNSSSNLSVSVLAGSIQNGMERDYDYTHSVYRTDLISPEIVGKRAADNAVRRLGARKGKTAKVPLIFDPRVSRGLLGHFASTINGSAIARGTSFLKDSMGKKIFPKNVQIIDDPHLVRGLRSKPCDGEGVVNQRRVIVKDGVLESWILDLRSARQLGLQTTGHAVRGISSPPSASVNNFWFEPGEITPETMMSDIINGFYVTELSGMGINMITGDYSRGAVGFWIENGVLTYPVNEVTIAGNLKDMFMNMTLANDLEKRYGIDAPTIRIDGMTIAGH
jgi:PmbA protein